MILNRNCSGVAQVWSRCMLATILMVTGLCLTVSAEEAAQDAKKSRKTSVIDRGTVKLNPDSNRKRIGSSIPLEPLRQPAGFAEDSSQFLSPVPMDQNVGEQVRWQVMSSGGGRGETATLRLSGSFNQVAAGAVNSRDHRLNLGYWQNFEGATSCCAGATMGNVDCRDGIDIGDISVMISKLFITLDEFCCDSEADLDYSGRIDITDLTILTTAVFYEPGRLLPPCP